MGKLKQDRNYTYKVTGKKIRLEYIIEPASQKLSLSCMELTLLSLGGIEIWIEGCDSKILREFSDVVDQAAVAGGTWEEVVQRLPDYF